MKPVSMLEVKRTLVKSGPELWAEISDPAAMARHLGPFGSIRITRAEPERLVEWEGDRAHGAVRLEPSGFGTRVILTAVTAAGPEPEAVAPEAPVVEPEPVAAEPEPVVADAPVPEPRRGFWARLFGRRRPPTPKPAAVAQPGPEQEPEPLAQPEPPAQPEPAPAEPVAEGAPPVGDETALTVLTDTLEALGTAHHRPYSRA